MHPSSLICRICGSKARGLNYDVMSCMSCKAFFQRNGLRPANTIRCRCRSKFNANITKENRNRCAACRLKKCFLVGMKPELIRSFAKQSLSTLKLTNTISPNNRLRLTCGQWTFISNIIRTCDETKLIHQMNCLLAEGSSMPIKLRVKQSFVLRTVQYCLQSVETMIKNSLDFQLLSLDSRRAIIRRNLLDICLVYSFLLRPEKTFLIDPNFVMSFTEIYGIDLLKKSIQLFGRIDDNVVVIKIMIFIVVFSSTSSTGCILQTDPIVISSISTELDHIQNIYITILWRYLVHQYGYLNAVLRYSSMVKTILDLNTIVEQMRRSEAYETLIKTIVKQIEHSLASHDSS